MISSLLHVGSILLVINSGLAQSGLNASMCVPNSGISTFTNCDTLVTNVFKCNSTTSQSDFESCFCNQDSLSEIFACEDEGHKCFGNDVLDTSLSKLAGNWHSACDEHISFTPTTPPIAAATGTFTATGSNEPSLTALSGPDGTALIASAAASASAKAAASNISPPEIKWAIAGVLGLAGLSAVLLS